MNYPSGAAYGDALQFPRNTLLDPMLSGGTVQSDSLGMPFGRSGQFALTYKVTVNGRHYAFRCFQSERPGIHERYIAISNERLANRLPYFVDFTYLDPGIRVQQKDYPALRMDWAEGVTLGSFIEQNLRDAGRLRALQQQLHGMALALEGAGIAHGDIQSGNILVGPSGELKLVDYDGMFVPGLAGLGSLETGHANFQHPNRAAANPFDASLDRFSFSLLHATLAGLAENPSLWSALGGEPEAPLLRRADFDAPDQSKAFTTLTRQPQSGEIFQRLMRVCQSPYAQTPTFSDFLAGRNIPSPAPTTRTTAGGARAGQDAPWYQQPASRPAAAAASPQALVDASDPVAMRAAVGRDIQIIGQVVGVETGTKSTGSPYAHLIFGEDPGTAPRVRITADGMQSLALARRSPDVTWVGQWVRVSGHPVLMAASAAGSRVAVDVSKGLQITHLTSAEAHQLLASQTPPAAPSSAASAGTNSSRLGALTGEPKKVSGTTPPATPPSPPTGAVTPPTGSRPPGRSDFVEIWLPLLGVLAFILLGVLLVAIILSAGSSSGSSSSTDPRLTDPPEVASPAAVPSAELTPASEMVGTCWEVDPTDSTMLLPVECAQTSAEFRVAKDAVITSDCSDYVRYITWDDGRHLCLEEWPPPTYKVCYEADTEDTPDCETGLTMDALSWSYARCWNVGAGAELQQRISGVWKTVKTDIAKRDKCEPGFAWTVAFTRKASGVGTKEYRLYFPPAGEFITTIENITVTVTKEK